MSRLDKKNLIWIDLEMTGLSLAHDHIIEIATLVTNTELEVIAEGPVLAIHQSAERLDAMDGWNKRQHASSGLLTRVASSRIGVREAEEHTLTFLNRYVPAGESPICGNSICHDRRFLCKEMPELAQYFHYRNLDVSTIKILAQRWAPEMASGFNKASKHLAMSDIYDSIEELKFYRQHFFKINH